MTNFDRLDCTGLDFDFSPGAVSGTDISGTFHSEREKTKICVGLKIFYASWSFRLGKTCFEGGFSFARCSF